MFGKMHDFISRFFRFIVRISQTLIRIGGRRKKKTIWLFGAPGHSNLGDQAQTYCIENWSRENFPDHQVFVYPTFERRRLDKFFYRWIHFIAGKEDLIFCHSGYHMTELWPLYKMYINIAEVFCDYPVTIFPQTVKFQKKETAEEVGQCFDAHPDCTLICRDEISYQFAKKIFRKTRLLLFPDIVTTLIGTRRYENQRNGLLFCLRNDVEAFYSNAQLDALMNRFEHIRKDRCDTTIEVPGRLITANRKKYLEEAFQRFSEYQVVVTDRYHGTIFSLIAGTPVVVISSGDHKLSSGVTWFQDDVFREYISFAKDLDEAEKIIRQRLIVPPTYGLSPYFRTKYYDRLAELIHVAL